MFSSASLIAIIAAASLFIVYMIVIQISGKKEKVREKVGQLDNVSYEQQEAFTDSLRSENTPSDFARNIESIMKLMGMDTEKFRKEKQLYFYQAGISSPSAYIYYMFYKRILSIVLVVSALLVVTAKGAAMMDYFEGLLLFIGGVMGADLYIKNLKEKRRKLLQNAFPDALDLLLACVESGLALDGSLNRVCNELGRAHPEMTKELNKTRRELSLLNDRSQALMNFSNRNGLPAFRSFVAALLQSEKFGTNLADTLRVLSEDYRTRRLMLAEEKAGRLPALMTVPLMLFMLPALFLIILGPAALSIMNAPADGIHSR